MKFLKKKYIPKPIDMIIQKKMKILKLLIIIYFQQWL